MVPFLPCFCWQASCGREACCRLPDSWLANWPVKLPLAYALAVPLGLGTSGVISASRAAHCSGLIISIAALGWGRGRGG